MPYWLSAGRETETGMIIFSAPEIVLYNRSAIDASASCRPGYPDFIEDVDGSIFITETNKQSALCHRVCPQLLKLLWAQYSLRTVATARLVASFSSGESSVALPPKSMPDLHAPYTDGIGVSVELWLSEYSNAKPGQIIVSTSPQCPLALSVSHRP